MKKSFFIISTAFTLSIGIIIGSGMEADIQVKDDHTEEFFITKHDGGHWLGEPTDGEGEGYLFDTDEYDLEIGQVVEVTWTKQQAENELWYPAKEVEVVAGE